MKKIESFIKLCLSSPRNMTLTLLLLWSVNYYGVTQINVLQIKASGTPSGTTFLRGDGAWAVPTAVLADADYGDITVSGTGTVLTIDNSAVTLAKMANITTASFLGRNTASTGVVEVLSVSTVRTLLSISNVDNTSDANKPISTATQTALDLKLTISKYKVRETPSGLINGSNTAYTLAFTPVAGTEQAYVNGLLQEPGSGNDYTISGAAITWLSALPSGTKLVVTYISQ